MRIEGCVDAGTEVCPCALAESGNCLICGRLSGRCGKNDGESVGKSGISSGRNCEDCCWQGVCVYTLREQNGRRKVETRKEYCARVVELKQYRDDFAVLVFEGDRGFCQKALSAGAYIFVRAAETEGWYDLPVSVLKSEPDKGLVHIAVKKCGPKSSSLLSAHGELAVRGIYYNGLSSLRCLSEDKTAIVYGRGLAVAPLRNFLDSIRYSRYLRNLHIYIDASKTGFDFIKDYFGDLPVSELHILDFSEPDFGDAVKKTAAVRTAGAATDTAGSGAAKSREVNLFALTSPYYADIIQNAWGLKAVRPNNSNMCCGEGVCGACSFDDEKGKTVHRCKAVLREDCAVFT